MSAERIGRRNTAFARYSILLFDDRVEEVSFTLAGLEVRRFFFDEADYLTVHRVASPGEVILAILLASIMAFSTYATLSVPSLAIFFGVLAALALGFTAYVLAFPVYQLTLFAPSPEKVECRLPRRPGAREEVLGRLTRAIVRHQSGTALGQSRTPAEAAR